MPMRTRALYTSRRNAVGPVASRAADGPIDEGGDWERPFRRGETWADLAYIRRRRSSIAAFTWFPLAFPGKYSSSV